MDVSCPACAAKYTCDDEKLRGKTARMRCKACGTAWVVSGPGASAAPAGAAPQSIIPQSMAPKSIPPPSMAPPKSLSPSMPPQSIPPPAINVASDEDKRAAVAKTGAPRENRDLFAAQEPDHGSIKVKDTLLPPPSFGFNTGSRNENSVLFRVDQLQDIGGRIKTPEPERLEDLARAQTVAQPARLSERPADEEGVIDLKQLASVPPPGKRSFVPVAPLFSEPPPMIVDANGNTSGSRPAIAKPISKGKLIGAIAAAMAFLVVAGAGLSMAFKGEEPVKHAAVETPAPVVTTPAAATTAAPAAPAPADTTASNDDDSPKKGKKGGKKGKKGGNSSATAAAKPVKAADPCGCKGDFNCILACTAKNGH